VWHHDGAIPVNGHKGPRQRARSNRYVDEARSGIVAEVQRAEVGKVEDEDDLSNGKVPVHKEQHKDDVEDVVEDEVAADAGCGVNDIGVAGEERGGISELEDKENNPVFLCIRIPSHREIEAGSLPVDLGNDMVQGKGGAVVIIQVPDGLMEVDLVVVRHSHGVVYADNDRRQPGQQDEDFVREHGAMAVRLPPREGVPCGERNDDGEQSVWRSQKIK
jgi:hypothetical protein